MGGSRFGWVKLPLPSAEAEADVWDNKRVAEIAMVSFWKWYEGKCVEEDGGVEDGRPGKQEVHKMLRE